MAFNLGTNVSILILWLEPFNIVVTSDHGHLHNIPKPIVVYPHLGGRSFLFEVFLLLDCRKLVSQSVSFCLSVCLFVWLFVCLVVCLVVCLFGCLSVCLFGCLFGWFCLFVWLFVCLFVWLFVWLVLFVCLFVCLSVCLFVTLLPNQPKVFSPSNALAESRWTIRLHRWARWSG